MIYFTAAGNHKYRHYKVHTVVSEVSFFLGNPVNIEICNYDSNRLLKQLKYLDENTLKNCLNTSPF